MSELIAKLFVLLDKEIQSLQARIEELEQKINKFESQE